MPTLTFTSSGSWTALAASIDCQCTGEGGSGAGGTTNNHSGAGGGGGAYGENNAVPVTVSTNYPFTIGSGGTGTDTTFTGDSSTVVTAAHGSNGVNTSAGAGGAAGAAPIAYAGSSGAAGHTGSGTQHGGAGGDAAGAGGTGTGGGGGSGGSGTGSGSPGSAPGGGGGGGGSSSSSHGGGAAGASGEIVIIYTSAIAGAATLAGTGTLTAQGGILGANNSLPEIAPGPAWLNRFARYRRNIPPPFEPPVTVRGTATLAGTGTLTALGTAPQPSVVNQWSASYGQGTTFTSITSALQSCVTPLTPAFSVGTGSGVPTAGNWLFSISSWTQDPAIANVHVGTGDDIHSYWREYPAAGPGGATRTAIAYTPNTARVAGNVYTAPDMEIAAINVLVIEVAGLGQWDTVVGTNAAYDAAATSISLSHAAGAQATFFIGAVGGDNIASGQAFLPSGWIGLATQTQTNGADSLADNILTAAVLPSTLASQSVSGSCSVAENLSGFMLAVLTSGASPVPAGHNPNWPYMVFEAGFGSGFNTPDSEITWTDITTRLWSWDETTGIKFDLGQLQSTDLTMELDNFDAALTSTNTASPYYPDVQPGTPLRLRAAIGTLGGVTSNRWYILQRNAAQWGEAIDDAYRRYCEVSGTDLWAALSATPPSFYRSEIYEDSPYAWWPMDDETGNYGVLPTFLLNAAQGNQNTLNIDVSPNGAHFQQVYNELGASSNVVFEGSAGASIAPGVAIYTVGANQGWMFGDPPGAPASLGTGGPVQASPGSASWQATGQTGSTGSYGWYLICNDNSFPSLTTGITLEIWFNYQFYGSANGFQTSAVGFGNFAPQVQQPYSCPLTICELATASGPVAVLQLDTSGHLSLIIGGTSHPVYSSSDLRSNSWHMVTMTLTSSSYAVWLDGGANAQVSGSASPGSSFTYFIVNADFGAGGGGSPAGIVHGGNASFAHAAIYPVVLPYYRILDHYWAAATAFGQLPAPTGTTVSWTLNPVTSNNQTQGAYAPDGTDSGSYATQSGTALSARVAAIAPGVTSVASSWNTASAAGITVEIGTGTGSGTPWVGWTGVAPQFEVYMAANPGGETGAALVNGSGDSFRSGYGASAVSGGVCAVSPGNGSSPPAAATVIGDTVGQRIERLMRAGRCSSPNRCIDPAPLPVQAPGDAAGGQQAGAAIQAIQQSDSGLLFVDNCNHLTYWQRPHLASQYSSPVWQLGPDTGSGQTPYYPEIRWITDPQHVYNVITISPLSPTGASLPLITPTNASAVNASQITYGAQPLPVTSWLQSTAEMQSQANWLFANFGTPQRRVQNVRIEAAAYPAAWIMIMGVNIGDVVSLEDWQIGGGGTVHTYRVTELKRELSFGAHGKDVTGHIELVLDIEPATYWS